MYKFSCRKGGNEQKKNENVKVCDIYKISKNVRITIL